MPLFQNAQITPFVSWPLCFELDQTIIASEQRVTVVRIVADKGVLEIEDVAKCLRIRSCRFSRQFPVKYPAPLCAGYFTSYLSDTMSKSLSRADAVARWIRVRAARWS